MGFRFRSDSLAFSVCLVCTAGLLLLPAVYNRFPLIFPDTSAYLQITFGHSWTVDRSGFYGLALKPASLLDPVRGLWLAMTLQTALIALVLLATVDRTISVTAKWTAYVMLGFVVIATSLPWHAAQLMPDAFTGPLVLLVWIATLRDPAEPGTPLLWLGVIALTLLHYTHLAIMPIVAIAVLGSRIVFGLDSKHAGRTFAAIVTCWIAAVGTQVATNGVIFHRWTVSPLGPYFLFARLQEDGLISDWARRHCGRDASPEFCAVWPKLPRDSQVLLWQENSSPLQQAINLHAGSSESWVWIDRLNDVALGSIRDEPFRFAANSLRAGASQFVRFEALDDECPSECHFKALSKSNPELGRQILRSRQVQASMPKAFLRSVTSTVAAAGLLLLVPLGVTAWRRRDPTSFSLLFGVAGGLLANALVTGALSDVHDRYQSRVVWLAPLAVAIILARWFSGHKDSAVAQSSARQLARPEPALSRTRARR